MSKDVRLITAKAGSPNAADQTAPTGGPADGDRLHLPGVEPEALQARLSAEGQPRYRAGQIMDWVYAKGAESFQQMSNLSKPLRTWLGEHADIYRARVAADSASTDGTHKLLLTWPDGASIETVWIPEGDRHTVCVSSQVGCPVGCRFCASGLAGVQRDLTAGEIVEQALRVRQLLVRAPAPGRVTEEVEGSGAEGPSDRIPVAGGTPEKPAVPRLSNIVFMGMGEPLANYEAVVQAIRILNAPWGLNIGARKITVSTVGLPKQIRRLADEGLQLNLALSLHAPEQKLREALIPWGKVPLEELLAACTYYFEKTGREITLEYVLLARVNMAGEHAARLAKIVRRLRANVNLLRYNPVPGVTNPLTSQPFERPSAEDAFEFQQMLRDHGVNAHVRTSRGRDIDAACGQLRRRMEQQAG